MHPSAVGHKFKKPFCPRGHDKREVGVYFGQCLRCRELNRGSWTKERKPYHFVEPICLRGHDKRVVGVGTNGDCAECKYIRTKQRRRRLAQNDPNSMLRAVLIPHLRETRQDLGMSMQELAGATGYHPSFLWRLEAGTCKATPLAQARILGAIAPLLSERKYEEAGL